MVVIHRTFKRLVYPFSEHTPGCYRLSSMLTADIASLLYPYTTTYNAIFDYYRKLPQALPAQEVHKAVLN